MDSDSDDDDLWGDEPDWFASATPAAKGADGEEDDEDDKPVPMAQHLVLLVDCGPSMTKQNKSSDNDNAEDEDEDEAAPFLERVWDLCHRVVRHQIRQSAWFGAGKRNGIGIVLYHTRPRTKIEGENEEENKKDSDDENDDSDEDDDDEGFGMTTTVHEVLALQPPGKDAVKWLRQVRDDDPFRGGPEIDLIDLYGHETSENNNNGDDDDKFDGHTDALVDALFEIPGLFKRSACVQTGKPRQPPDGQHVWICTNNASILKNTDDSDNRLVTALQDNREAHIQVTLVPMNETNDTEDPLTLPESLQPHLDILEAVTENNDGDDDNGEAWAETAADQWDLWQRALRRSATVPLVLDGPAVAANASTNQQQQSHIQLDLYYLCQVGVKPSSKQYTVHNETGRKLDRLYQYMSPDGALLMQTTGTGHDKRIVGGDPTAATSASPIHTFVEFGGETVRMSHAERDAIRTSCNVLPDFAAVSILGFRPRSEIPFWHTLERSYFAVPNEETTAGSTEAFAYLHASMMRKNVVAIAERVLRVNQQSRLIALIPLAEERDNKNDDEDGGEDAAYEILRPAGFLMINLPYEDEVRMFDTDNAAHLTWDATGADIASDALVESAEALVRKATLQDAEIGVYFPNEPLINYWKYIELIALDEHHADSAEDDEEESELQVNPELAKHAAQEIEHFLEALPAEESKSAAKKATTGSKRKVRQPDESGVDWRAVWKDDDLASCKVPELKAKLKSLGAKVGGKKQDLVERLAELLDAEFAVKAEPK